MAGGGSPRSVDELHSISMLVSGQSASTWSALCGLEQQTQPHLAVLALMFAAICDARASSPIADAAGFVPAAQGRWVVHQMHIELASDVIP